MTSGVRIYVLPKTKNDGDRGSSQRTARADSDTHVHGYKTVVIVSAIARLLALHNAKRPARASS